MVCLMPGATGEASNRQVSGPQQTEGRRRDNALGGSSEWRKGLRGSLPSGGAAAAATSGMAPLAGGPAPPTTAGASKRAWF